MGRCFLDGLFLKQGKSERRLTARTDESILREEKNKMTKGEYLQNKIDECITKANSISDVNLKMFYINASRGFEKRRESMKLSELSEKL